MENPAHVRALANSISNDHAAQRAEAEGVTHLFTNVEQLKDKAANYDKDEEERQRKEKAKYNDTIIGRIVKHEWFERTTIAVIMLNALWIGWDTDFSARIGKEEENLYKGDIGFIIAENFFATYFTFEILMRLFAYRNPCHCFCDAWFVFDSFLVILMVLETWVLPFASSSGGLPIPGVSVLRLLRLLRITRVMKLMRMFPELMMIINGITAAVKAVFWTAILLLVITFTWAILFTNEYHQGKIPDDELEGDSAPVLFGSMGKSMKHLLIMGTILDDVTYCTDTIRASENIWMLLFFLLYILFNSFTMLNMLVGILVEVVGATADGEKERFAEEHLQITIKALFKKLDKDSSGLITRSEFVQMKGSRTVMKALEKLGITDSQFSKYADLLFENNVEGVDFQNLLTLILKLRPGTPVSALDFAAFRQVSTSNVSRIRARVRRVESMLGVLCGQGERVPDEQDEDDGEWEWEEKNVISVEMLATLEHSTSAEIVMELQRRLDMSSLEETGVPLSMMDEELQARVRATEAFQQLGVPEPEPEWGKEPLNC